MLCDLSQSDLALLFHAPSISPNMLKAEGYRTAGNTASVFF